MNVRNALILAALMIAFSIAVAAADKSDLIAEQTARRAVQVAAGLVLAFFANLVPKTLEPLTGGCDPARRQAMQRFTGWTLVLAGLGYSLTWLVAPFERAPLTSMAIVGAGLLLVAARCAWTLARGRARPDRPEGSGT